MAVLSNGSLEGSFSEEMVKLLLSLAKNWGDTIDVSNFKVVPLKGAMTNEVYRITWPSKKQDDIRTVLVRVYGEGVDLFFNRDEEIRTFECVSKHGYGPKLLGHSPEGRVEEFIHARTLSAPDIRDPKISAHIAEKMREFHKLDMPGLKNVLLWDRMRNWLRVAKNLSSPEHAKEFRLQGLDAEINLLEQKLSCGNDDIGFCHNDLQYGNIMIDEKTCSITIIDYEYAGYNPIAYDLANHFCEMAADYHSETPHVLDYTKYPGSEERRRFIRLYLTSEGNEISDTTEVEKLVHKAEKFSLANHLFWGLWGIISSYVSNIDFDYMEYARQRFEQYWLNKHKLL